MSKQDNNTTGTVGFVKFGDETFKPRPINRGIIVDNPMSRVPKSTIELSPELEEERRTNALQDLFPEGIIPYTVLYIDETSNIGLKVGDVVALIPSALHRAMRVGTKMIYINAGDIALVWEKAEVQELSNLLLDA